MKENSCKIEIKENYRNYVPPASIVATVTRLIDGISSDYLAGIKTIVLTNFEALNHNRRRQKNKSKGKKVAVKYSRGRYYHKYKGDPAWIELFVEKMLPNDVSKIILCIPFVCDMFVSDVLFHEIGHHIHAIRAPEHKEPEDVAEKWKKKLTKEYFTRKYWYVLPILRPLWNIIAGIIKLNKLIHRKRTSGVQLTR